MNKECLKGHLPVLVLGVIDRQPMHGYAVVEALGAFGDSRFELGEGTIYPLLHRLERQGHVTASWERGATGKLRKVYTISPSGRALIREHRSDFQNLAALFQSVFGNEWAGS